MNANYYVRELNLLPHPEGGFYKETYRAAGIIAKGGLPATFGGNRAFSTAIYYLLQQGDFSAFHRIKSDECWHFYAGDTLLIHVLDGENGYTCLHLGSDVKQGATFQCVVPAGAWFASEPAPGSSFCLTGCTVAPGFDFADFEMAKKEDLVQLYPACETLIDRLCR